MSAAGAAAAGRVRAAENDKIGVAFIGVGGRGSSLLKDAIGIDKIAIRAICDKNPERTGAAQQAVAAAGRPKPDPSADWRQVLERKDIDAVVSALPCNLHARNYLDAIAAGKDVYGEKPMALTVKDCDAVVKAANASKQIVQIGFQRRADPRFVETVKLVHGGELGKLIEGRVLWSIGQDWGPRLGDFGYREISGDWMVEQAVHNWDTLNWATQAKPVLAFGLGNNELFRDLQPDRDVHDYYSGVLQYDNGVIVNIVHSWIAGPKFHDEYTQLAGTMGMVDFNKGIISYHHLQKKADRETYPTKGYLNSTLLALNAFFDSVRTRKPPVATVEHGRDAVHTCLLMREAVYQKRPVKMTDILS